MAIRERKGHWQQARHGLLAAGAGSFARLARSALAPN